jgi:predicted nucleic acid-binding protein
VATGSSGRPAPLRGPVYVDASALVKLYVPERESDELNRTLKGRRDLLVSDLAVTEVVSSLARRRREGALETESVVRLYRALLAHLEDRVFRRIELVPGTHRDAEKLLLSLDAVPLRSADALHLALAMADEAACVVTYDGRLADAARAVGLQVHPRAVER